MVASVTLFIFHRLDVCLSVPGTVVTKHHYNNKHFYQMRCLHGHSDLIVVGIARMFPVIINVRVISFVDRSNLMMSVCVVISMLLLLLSMLCQSIVMTFTNTIMYSVSQTTPPLRFSDNFSKRLGIFNQFLHTYYTFLSTLDDKFLFNYFQL